MIAKHARTDAKTDNKVDGTTNTEADRKNKEKKRIA